MMVLVGDAFGRPNLATGGRKTDLNTELDLERTPRWSAAYQEG
jgi:hypothetical protein